MNVMNETFPPVAEILPHAGPAVLIDAVLMNTPDRICAAAYITREHPYFVADLGVPSWVGIEMMAQTVAAHAGLTGRAEGRAPRAGMLLGTRRYRAETGHFPEGARLEIEADREFGDVGGVAACACRIRCDGQILVEATITIIEVDAEKMP